MAGVTLDTGVFIALERRQRRALSLWEKCALTTTTLTVPAVVIAEWWRDRQWDAARWLGSVEVEPVDEALARIASEVLGELRLGREHAIDAIVMASAAQRGDAVCTSDFDDDAAGYATSWSSSSRRMTGCPRFLSRGRQTWRRVRSPLSGAAPEALLLAPHEAPCPEPTGSALRRKPWAHCWPRIDAWTRGARLRQ
jgi:predicted nucleic acid-binding protein